MSLAKSIVTVTGIFLGYCIYEQTGEKITFHQQPATMERSIARLETSRQMREGGGFLVRRPVGDKIDFSACDPFLMLDHLGPVEYGPGEAVGAPDHPHRGFETVTYIIDGEYKYNYVSFVSLLCYLIDLCDILLSNLMHRRNRCDTVSLVFIFPFENWFLSGRKYLLGFFNSVIQTK